MNVIILSLITLVSVSALSSIILYLVSKRFKVSDDPLIDNVLSDLPSVNCGGCGYPSCRSFAIACVNAESLEHLVCTVGGLPVMEKVAGRLNKRSGSLIPTVAVLRCGGSCDKRPRTNRYDGVNSCAIIHNLYGGETDCTWGCLGSGDCVVSCKFDAIYINPVTLLPEIDEAKCTSCNACVKACPKALIELKNKGLKSRRIYVNCMNQDKEEQLAGLCAVACIGCGKCVQECAYGAITMNHNLAFIDSAKCTLCRRCVAVCPTHAIAGINFPLHKPVKEKSDQVIDAGS